MSEFPFLKSDEVEALDKQIATLNQQINIDTQAEIRSVPRRKLILSGTQTLAYHASAQKRLSDIKIESAAQTSEASNFALVGELAEKVSEAPTCAGDRYVRFALTKDI